MCQYCGNTGLCGLFFGAVLIKVWQWIVMFFQFAGKRFRKRKYYDEKNII